MERRPFFSKYSPSAIKIASLYLALSTAWILLSDRVSYYLFQDSESLSTIQTFKGWLFVAVTSLVIFLLIERKFRNFAATEDALRKSEHSLQSIFRAAPIGLGVVRNRVFNTVNDRLSEMTGYSRQELLNHSSRLLYADQDEFERVGKEFEAISESEITTIETTWQRKDGTQIDVLISATLLNAQDLESGVTFTALDITERNKSAAALKESERKFALAFSASPDAVNINRLEDGLYVEINQGFMDLTGFTRKEVLGRTSLDINIWHDPKDRDRLVQALRTTGYCENLEAIFRKKDGTVATGLMSARIIELNNVPHIISITREIEKLKRAEKKILFQKKLFETMFNAITDGIVITDTDNRIRLANRGMATTFGYAPEELVGKSMEVLYEKALDFAAASRTLFNGERQHAPELYTTLYRDRYGRSFPGETFGTRLYDDADRWIGNLGIMRDITRRNEDEADLKRLKVAIEQAGEVIVITDREGLIQYTNPAFEQVTGYTREEALLQSPKILKSGMHEAPFYQELWKTISSGRTWSGRMVNRHKNGNLFTEEATISPVVDRSGEITNYVAIKRDITDQLKLEAQYQQAQKMESVGRLTGGVAHDFNNILSVIIGYSEMLLDQLEPSSSLYADVEKILEAGQRSAEIIRQLLAFSRKQTIVPRVLDLNETVAGMLKMLIRLIGEDIHLSWIPSAAATPVKMDPSQLDQILANLCVNARDAIDGVGRVTIETGTATLDREYCANNPGSVPGQYVTLVVSDDGVGMDKDVTEKIFEPFFTTKGMHGTGLGLATVYGIVKQNLGFIQVYSEPGEGTTFRIYLPIHGDEAVWKAEVKTQKPASSRGESILLVEDDQLSLEMAASMLERLNYKVFKASSPQEALQLAENNSGKIDLLITDVIMPEMNGKALSSQIVSISPGLKVLYISGYTANVIAHHGILDEGVNFLQKPFAREDLAVKIREVLDSLS